MINIDIDKYVKKQKTTKTQNNSFDKYRGKGKQAVPQGLKSIWTGAMFTEYITMTSVITQNP